jgi:hypothetical protein
MKLNLKKFESVLRKATINFSIETVQLKFGEKIKANLKSNEGNCISILNIPNDVLDIKDEEFVFNFAEPNQNVLPYVQLFDSDEVDVVIDTNFMKLILGVQISKLCFCSDTTVKLLGVDRVKEDVDWFFELKIDDVFMNKFEKIGKIGARFGKIYFFIEDHLVYIETADKTNPYSNGLKFELASTERPNLVLSFAYKDMVNLMSIIDITKNFKAKFQYMEEQTLGMMYVFSEDGSEKYCILSQEL